MIMMMKFKNNNIRTRKKLIKSSLEHFCYISKPLRNIMQNNLESEMGPTTMKHPRSATTNFEKRCS